MFVESEQIEMYMYIWCIMNLNLRHFRIILVWPLLKIAPYQINFVVHLPGNIIYNTVIATT